MKQIQVRRTNVFFLQRTSLPSQPYCFGTRIFNEYEDDRWTMVKLSSLTGLNVSRFCFSGFGKQKESEAQTKLSILGKTLYNSVDVDVFGGI